MTTDMTIHPVVELRVGPYKGNEGEHRRCEMHQDAFIFPRVMNVGDTGLSEHLATGIGACHAADDEDELDEEDDYDEEFEDELIDLDDEYDNLDDDDGRIPKKGGYDG